MKYLILFSSIFLFTFLSSTNSNAEAVDQSSRKAFDKFKELYCDSYRDYLSHTDHTKECLNTPVAGGWKALEALQQTVIQECTSKAKIGEDYTRCDVGLAEMTLQEDAFRKGFETAHADCASPTGSVSHSGSAP